MPRQGQAATAARARKPQTTEGNQHADWSVSHRAMDKTLTQSKLKQARPSLNFESRKPRRWGLCLSLLSSAPPPLPPPVQFSFIALTRCETPLKREYISEVSRRPSTTAFSADSLAACSRYSIT